MGGGNKRERKKAKGQRAFDMSKYERRHVALRFMYIGQGYQGLALQDHTTETVESVLFDALRKLRLITDEERVPEGYSRCGRTDKGVSALGQVVAMRLRSAKTTEDPGKPEHDYVGMLNRVLPADIKVIGWAYVPDNFSARFTCSGRVYKYFFLKGAKDVEKMRAGAARLVGEHDFRNFAKMDVVNVSNFVRKIFSMTIKPLNDDPASPVWVVTVAGTAFLYHQVRCMVAVLFDIGDGKEDPEVVTQLLDAAAHPAKPCYPMASDLGLVLWDCLFPSVQWHTTGASHEKLLQHFAAQYEAGLMIPMIHNHMRHALAANEPLAFLADPAAGPPEGEGYDAPAAVATGVWDDAAAALFPPRSPPKHVPLLARPVEKTYEEKVADMGGSRKTRYDANQLKAQEAQESAAPSEPGMKRTAAEAELDDDDGGTKRVPHLERTELCTAHIQRYL
eukprot:TRINITY_DN20834_c0_g1_i1.p1 TRINITY_DN20834_c0_g1~~TRINITY_DN20834_c0_g1_i1.p1  ORF type:complete len:467 (+),score=191.21 TRINITY_DN20834_c0_g1_i1:59-1402(+)